VFDVSVRRLLLLVVTGLAGVENVNAQVDALIDTGVLRRLRWLSRSWGSRTR
jgi:hypothetical protein